MTDYALVITEQDGVVLLTASELDNADFDSPPIIVLGFSLANVLDPAVYLLVSVNQIENINNELAEHSLSLKFIDRDTDDVVYNVSGMLVSDENQTNSIVAVMNALEDFDNVQLLITPVEIDADIIDMMSDQFYYNKMNGDGRNFERTTIPAGTAGDVKELYDLVTTQDDQPTVMYMQLGDDLSQFTEMTRIATRLGVRLIVELDPTLTLDQAIETTNDLNAFNMHVMFIWAPIIARPINAVGLKGKKVPRYCGGVLLAHYLKRQANVNAQGIPAIHRPIAGFDYPFSFIGIQQAPDLVLNDQALKRLARAQINIVKRERFPQGIRFILNDVLTGYGDNTSVLKLANASEISMFIDNRLKEICKRHMLKDMDGTIGDATKEAKRFLEACTTKTRPLLRKSQELGGFFQLSITPNEASPDDKIDLECAYRPQGAGRVFYLKTAVTR